jgi:hypothetical protein
MAIPPAHSFSDIYNEKALNKIKTGLSEKGTIKRGSFAKYAEE